MGLVSKSLRSAIIAAGGLAIVWNVFIDERAKHSVMRAVKVTGNLASQALSTYMDPMAEFSSEEAAEFNRSWVEQQWRNIGY